VAAPAAEAAVEAAKPAHWALAEATEAPAEAATENTNTGIFNTIVSHESLQTVPTGNVDFGDDLDIPDFLR
jgi:hypothetical protein